MMKKIILSAFFVFVTFSLMLIYVFCEAQAADKSLVLYFPFDEGKGDVTEDKSNFDRQAMLTGKIEKAKWTYGRLNFISKSNIFI